MTRIVLLHALLTLLILLSPQAHPQQSADSYATYDFDIPSETVHAALESFQERTGVRVSYIPDSLKQFYTTAVRGQFTARQALQLMLGAVGVDIEWAKPDAVYVGLLTRSTLQRFEQAGITKYDGMRGRDAPYARNYALLIDRMPLFELIEPLSYYFGLRFQIPPSDQAVLRTDVGPLNGSLSPVATLDYLLKDTGLTWEWVGEEMIRIRKRSRSELPDVMVEASRLWPFTPDGKPPSVQLGREEIDRSGASSIAQLMRYVAQQPFWRSEGLRTDGAQGVQLRGLGSDTTLVLINGHRVGATANLYDANSFDLNTIPLAAVARVEIYLDATPFSIGADAIGGILNIVMTEDAREPKVDLHYGAADSGGRERRISFTGGTSRDALSATVVLDYFERDRLLGAERDRWRNQDYQRFGGADFRSTDSNPGNVSSLTGTNLPGLPSTFAAVPPNHGEVLTPSDFLRTAGQRNFESIFAYRSILPQSQRASAVLSTDWKVSASSQVFSEFMATDSKTVMNDFPSSLSNAMVPAENPFNPFGIPVRSSFMFTAIDRERINENSFARGLLRFRGEMPRWSWEATLLRTEDRSEQWTKGDLNFPRVIQALGETDPNRALNVFDDGPGGSSSLLSEIVAPAITRDYRSVRTQAAAQARVDVFTWREGTVSTVFGAEWADLEISAEALPLPIEARRSVLAGFVDLHVPLLAGAVRDVVVAEVQGRIDRIGDLRTVANSQLTLDWQPSSALLVRGTYATNYRAPSLYELYQPVITVTAPIVDPKRGNEVVIVPVSFGGNPDLKLATARSWSVGFNFAPPWLNGFSLTATYWQTQIKDRISLLDVSIAFGYEDLFRQQLVRAAPSPQDIELGRPGRIRSIDLTSEGGGTLKASGVDVHASFEIDTRIGRISPGLSATWMDQFRAVEWPGLDAVERVAVASSLGSVPRWHAIAGVTWDLGPIELTSKARVVSAYADASLFQNRKTGRDVATQTLFDIQASVNIEHGIGHEAWRGIKIISGVENLLDREPPFAEIGGLIGYDPSHGDLRERFAYLRFVKEF